MSSVTRSPAQVGFGLKHYRTTASTVLFIAKSGYSSAAVMSTTDFGNAFDATLKTDYAGQLRDMGKTITTYNSYGMHVATYAKVQKVDDDGLGNEGVAKYDDILTAAAGEFYVLVWSAIGTGVTVARV